MEHNNSESEKSLEVRNFNEYMQRGDDFYRIELLRQAKAWYTKALSFNIDNEKVKSQIYECERQLTFENKIVTILISIGVVLLAYIIIFN